MQWYRTDQKKLVETLLRKGTKYAAHRDADGVYSLSLLARAFKISPEQCEFPDIFGDYNSEVGISLDLGQSLYPDWTGTAIDHHFHPDIENKKYGLVWDTVPTGLIVFNLFKDRIPQEEWWKLAGSLVGDDSADLIPIEVWEKNPILLEKRGTVHHDTYNKTKKYDYLVYKLLASPVNSSCRAGRAHNAFEIVNRSKSPDEILLNTTFSTDSIAVNAEISVIVESLGKKRKRNTVILKDLFEIVPISSSFFVASRIASQLKGEDANRTYIVINDNLNEISIRGDLAGYIKEKMATRGWSIGGHAGAMGGTLVDKKADDFIEDARAVL